MERDSERRLSRGSTRYFNSRAHVERDGAKPPTAEGAHRFQLTRSRGARQSSGKYINYKHINFNSRAHVERDEDSYKKTQVQLISTHALTWSATSRTLFNFYICCRFQLTRSRGARLTAQLEAYMITQHFNSRAHVERDSRALVYALS